MTALPSPDHQKQAYQVKEFCAAFGIGRSTFYKEVGGGRLRTFKVGKRTLVSRQAALDWIQSLEKKTNE